MEQLLPHVFRILPGEEPLSSDVFVVEGENRYYVYDVGSNDEALRALEKLEKPVWVILSHFHQDHTANMARFSPEEVWCGARTKKYIGRGTTVEEERIIEDGVRIRVLPCVSPHAPGSLVMVVDDTWAFLGDLCYARPGMGRGEARGMYRVLKGMPVSYFIQSHRKEGLLQEKEALLREIREYFEL